MRKRILSLLLTLVTLCYGVPNMVVLADEIDNTTYIEQEKVRIEKEKYFEQKRIDHEAQMAEKKQQSNEQEQSTIELYSTVYFAGGDGSKNNPYQISTPEQLDAVRNNLTANYILINDIDLSEWGDWKPIGRENDESPFQGTFNGNKHTIENINMGILSAQYSSYAGLFSYIENATIKDLNLENIVININEECEYVGGIAGYASGNINLINCTVNGNFLARLDVGTINIGGMIGNVYNSNIKIQHCENNCDITVTVPKSDIYSGGLIGMISSSNHTTISDSINNGNITIISQENDSSIGGIIGYSERSSHAALNIYNSINNGKLKGAMNVGGILGTGGSINGYQVVIEDCKNNCSIYSEANSGGIVGLCIGTIWLYSCNNYGEITSPVNMGGIIGYADIVYEGMIKLKHCINNGELYINSTESNGEINIGGIIGKFENYAVKRQVLDISHCSNNVSIYNSHYGSGIIGHITMSTCANISINNCINNKSISASLCASGILGCLDGNLSSYGENNFVNIADCVNKGQIFAGKYAGGIIANAEREKIVIITCTNTAEIESDSYYSGGIAGYLQNTEIKNSTNNGNIKARSSAGGIISTGNANITNCNNNGKIIILNSTLGGEFGGIAGSMEGDIIDSTNSGDIKNISCSGSKYCVGGIVGRATSSYIKNSNNNGNININIESQIYVGGILGEGYKNTKINDSSNNGDIKVVSKSSIIEGGVVGHANANYANADIVNCKNQGILEGKSESKSDVCIGGIFGEGAYNIENSINKGYISAEAYKSYAGGLVASGYLDGIINGCTNMNTISAKSNHDSTYSIAYAGGIIGNAAGTIKNSTNKGQVIADTYAGGIAGYVQSKFTINPYCYFSGYIPAIGGQSNSAVIIGLENAIPLDYSSSANSDRYNTITFKVSGYPDTDVLTSETWAIENASVTFGGVTKSTDSDGKVSFSKDEIDWNGIGTPMVEVSANEYLKYSQEILIAVGGDNYISLKKKDPNKIYIESLILKDNDDKKYDLLHQNEYSIDKTDMSKQTLNIKMDWNGHDVGSIYLRGANSGKMLEFTDGQLITSLGQEFDADENVMVVAYTADKSKKTIQENIVNILALPPEFTLEIPEQSSGDMSFIPFMEGKEFKLGLDKGIEKYAVKTSVKDGKLVLDFSDSSIAKKTNEFKFFDKSKLSIGPYGKLEIPISSTSDGEWSGTFGFKTEKSNKAEEVVDYAMIPIAAYDYNTIVMIGTVPLPVTASVEFKGGAKGELTLAGTLQTPKFSGKLEPSAGVDVFGGLGQDYDTVEVKAGVYGDMTGKLPISCNFMSNSWDFNPALEGSIGARASVKVYVVDLEGKIEAGKFKWSRDGFEASWLGDKLRLMSVDDVWKLAGREYLENGGGFVGDSSQIELFDLDVSNKDERLIYENIFANAEAVLQNIDGKNYLIYTVDDTDREQQNGLKLVYSTQSGDGTWSSPVAISDDGTLDSTVSSSGKFAIWEDMKSPVSADTTNMSEILSQTEISVAQFNGSEWTSERLTDDSKFDFSPAISSNGNTAIASWLSNSEADFSSQNGTTNLHYATYDGSAWSDVTTIEDIGKVTRVTLDYDGTNGNIFYKKDGSLYSVSTMDNTETELGYSEVGQYTIGRYNGQTVLAYFDKDNNLQVITDVMNSKNQSSIEADINVNSIPIIKSNGTDMYICWIDHEDGYDTLCGVRYENGKWSDKIAFVDDEANVSNPSLMINDDGTFTTSYFKTGKAEVQDDGSYTTGTTNLYINNIVPSYNLALNQETLTYNDEAYSMGGVAALTFDVNNIGEKAVGGVSVEIYEGDELKQAIEKDVSLKAGETQNMSVVYTPTEKNIVQDITLKVMPKRVDDFDDSDNSGIITLGAVDLNVSSAYFTQEGGQYYVNAVLNNNGSVPVDEMGVQIHRDSVDGEVLYETVISDVLANEELFIKEPVDVIGTTANYFVTVSAVNDIDEYNNFSMAVLDNSEPDLDFTVMEDNYNSDRSQLDLSIKTVNNTEVDKSVELIMVAYDMNGTLQKVIKNKSTMQIGQNTIDASFDCTGLSDDFTFKLFIWNSIDGMQPISNAFEKVINIAN